MQSFLLDVYDWADETFYFLEREWGHHWDVYALVGGFFLLLVFLRFVYLPRRVAAQAAREGVARGGEKDVPSVLLTCPRCRNAFSPSGQTRDSFCPYCGTLHEDLPGRRFAGALAR